jgi:hypothetical protein
MDLIGKSQSITSSVLSSASFIGKKGANIGRSALVSVANIPGQITQPSFLNNTNTSLPSRSSSGASFDILGGLMSGSSSRGYGTNSSHDQSSHDYLSSQMQKSLPMILSDLGLYDEDQELERLAIFYQFNKSCDIPTSAKGKIPDVT